MGTDFQCGCRCSMGHWFLCDLHESEIIDYNLKKFSKHHESKIRVCQKSQKDFKQVKKK